MQLILNTNVGVYDINHGGFHIAKKLKQFGYIVTLFDVYEKIEEKKIKYYLYQENLIVSKKIEDIKNQNQIISPIHLSNQNIYLKEAIQLKKNIMSHHECVACILKKDSRLLNIKIIEITGTIAKTSTALLYSYISSYDNIVALSTTKGLEVWTKKLQTYILKKNSISPSNILSNIDLIFDRGYRPNIIVLEISLGFLGFGNIGLLTSLEPEYKIAQNSMTSTEAKLKCINNK